MPARHARVAETQDGCDTGARRRARRLDHPIRLNVARRSSIVESTASLLARHRRVEITPELVVAADRRALRVPRAVRRDAGGAMNDAPVVPYDDVVGLPSVVVRVTLVDEPVGELE